MTNQVLGARYHHSGATKPCTQCGGEIRRRANTSATDWADRRYCGVACVNRVRKSRRGRPDGSASPRPLTAPPSSWMEFAPCRGQPTDFVPDTQATAGTAIRFCGENHCPFRAQCLAYGRSTKSFGVWGARYLEFGKIITSSRHGAGR